jgi:hypothetical protein
MELIKTGFEAFKTGFSYLFLTSFVIWMISLIVLLFMELFRPDDLNIREYFAKVWRMLVYSFEYVAYAGVVIAPFMIYYTEDKELEYSMLLAAAIILSFCFLYLHTQTSFYKVTMARKSKKERPARYPNSGEFNGKR